MRSIETLDNLTVIIPTYNRVENLSRLVDFYQNTNVKLIVLDGSSKPNLRMTNTKVKYMYLSDSNLHERLLYSSKLVDTKYVAICADDDFIFPRGLERCIRFLDAHPDYSSVQGAFIRFNYDQFFSWRPDYVHWNAIRILEDDPIDRTLNSRKSCQFLYSTMRASTFKSVVSAFTGVNSGSLTMNELAFNYIVPFLGKYQTIPVIYGARLEHAKSGVNMRYSTWIKNYDTNCETYLNNIERIYSSYVTKSKASELQKIMTRVFVDNDQLSLESKPIRQKIRSLNRVLRSFRSLNTLRPINSIERIKWFITLRKSINKELNAINILKKHVSENKIAGTPSL